MPRTHLKPRKTLRFHAPSTRSQSICKPKISFYLRKAKDSTSQTLSRTPATAKSSYSPAPHSTKMQTPKVHTRFLARLTPQPESSATRSGEAVPAVPTGTTIQGTCTLTNQVQAWTSRSPRPVSILPFSHKCFKISSSSVEVCCLAGLGCATQDLLIRHARLNKIWLNLITHQLNTKDINVLPQFRTNRPSDRQITKSSLQSAHEWGNTLLGSNLPDPHRRHS